MDESRTTVRDFVGLISFLIGTAIVWPVLLIAPSRIASLLPNTSNGFEVIGFVVLVIGASLFWLLQ